MLFALVCAVLLLIVLIAIGLPLLSNRTAPSSRGHFDRTVYSDQLREVERDLGRGVLRPDEADAARLEIQRRLLSVDTETDRPIGAAPGRSPLLAAVAALFVVLSAGGLYWRLGAPTLADAPFAGRPGGRPEARPEAQNARPPAPSGEETHTDMRQAATRLEQKLRADPSNGEGWVLYARTESMLGDWTKAASAYPRAIELGQ
jgi:cytochrome c-type biogenesis protein CcmH